MIAPEDLFHYVDQEEEYIFEEMFGGGAYSLYQKSKDSGPAYTSWEAFADEFFARPHWYTTQPKYIDKSLFASILTYINAFKLKNSAGLSFAQHRQLYAWEMAIYDDGKYQPKQFCSNCQTELPYFARYPKAICRSCTTLLSDKNGKRVAYHNTQALGYGVQGIYVESQEKYNSLDCFIGLQPFRAAEHRFGGIVVQRSDC